MKKLIACFLIVAVFLSLAMLPLSAQEAGAQTNLHLNATSAVLMEASTGTVLYEQNADEQLPPASITKIMTLLLVMEALAEGKIALAETVTASERAASMGGSQIFLKVGEQMSVEDLLKSVVIASANDAAAALAEHLCGTIESFVEEMNARAVALGMQNTHFENTNGLDDTTVEHYTSARDVAIMSRELIKHELILQYSSTWMDSVRNGEFGLTNTNRLVRFYPGATGLKTGSTAKARFCISATAKREGMHLIAVIMGSPTRDIRNEEAKKLLDYGFANYAVYTDEEGDVADLPVLGGVRDVCRVRSEGVTLLVNKSDRSKIEKRVHLPAEIVAPVKKGETIGKIGYYVGETQIGEARICVTEDVEKLSFWLLFSRILKNCFCVTE